MIFVSHRGNVIGPDKKLENNPQHISELSQIHQVEVDLWCVSGELFLGHDYPTNKINNTFFNDNLWIHCKNIEAVDFISKSNYNWFWHDTDKVTITSNGTIWCFPNIYLKNGITVMMGYTNDIPNIKGICTDYLKKYI
jgi:hypothetical protein